jgi:hypothetical protein
VRGDLAPTGFPVAHIGQPDIGSHPIIPGMVRAQSEPEYDKRFSNQTLTVKSRTHSANSLSKSNKDELSLL